ncbi:hypothetical protein BD410DRAFT_616704 [Rickenella mellea]|uniref:Uncharacterized protein n=1 Tax=Rickenella mellea TaxID=50990 RepID=A0A4Y7PN43_9AGAM|nr:hypothetical protein BD410DRAFT_616704 [Rickenella mellea]
MSTMVFRHLACASFGVDAEARPLVLNLRHSLTSTMMRSASWTEIVTDKKIMVGRSSLNLRTEGVLHLTICRHARPFHRLSRCVTLRLNSWRPRVRFGGRVGMTASPA